MSDVSTQNAERPSDILCGEEGSLSIFSLFVFVLILMMSGMAVDLMRHEHQRVRMQNTLDAAVLAAASATQERNAEDVVRDYITSAGFEAGTVTFSGYDVNGESVAQASANVSSGTMFMNLLGVNSLNSASSSYAVERISAVEVSLVLDFTSSMKGARIAALRGAAHDFVDMVFNCDPTAVTCVADPDSNITVNVVPYGGTVNPGTVMAARMGLKRWHGYSSCGVLPSSSYNDTTLPAGAAYQMPHFYIWNRQDLTRDQEFGWCPQDGNTILYGATDPQAIKDYVDSLNLNDGTGTNIGMKWGMALLDSTSRDDIAALAAAGVPIGNTSGDFPADDADHVLKVVVLMTDGGITFQTKPRDFDYNSVYDDLTGELIVPDEDIATSTDPVQEALRETLERYGSLDEEGNLRARSDIEFSVPHADRKWARDNPTITRDDGIDQLEAQCALAKQLKTNGEERVTVYTIRFLETAQWTEDYMKPCATADSHYYDVQTVTSLGSAFRSIAQHINSKKLSLGY